MQDTDIKEGKTAYKQIAMFYLIMSAVGIIVSILVFQDSKNLAFLGFLLSVFLLCAGIALRTKKKWAFIVMITVNMLGIIFIISTIFGALFVLHNDPLTVIAKPRIKAIIGAVYFFYITWALARDYRLLFPRKQGLPLR